MRRANGVTTSKEPAPMRTWRVGFKQTEHRTGYVEAENEEEARLLVRTGQLDGKCFGDMHDDDCEITFIEDWSDDDERRISTRLTRSTSQMMPNRGRTDQTPCATS